MKNFVFMVSISLLLAPAVGFAHGIMDDGHRELSGADYVQIGSVAVAGVALILYSFQKSKAKKKPEVPPTADKPAEEKKKTA
jgi:hypothetical protein